MRRASAGVQEVPGTQFELAVLAGLLHALLALSIAPLPARAAALAATTDACTERMGEGWYTDPNTGFCERSRRSPSPPPPPPPEPETDACTERMGEGWYTDPNTGFCERSRRSPSPPPPSTVISPAPPGTIRPADPPTAPVVSVRRAYTLPFIVSETGASEKSYEFSVASTTEVSVSLTGMDRDIDCSVNGRRCTNRGGTADDSWSGTLHAGTHTVTVYPYGGGSGSWTLGVGGTSTSPPPAPPPPSPPGSPQPTCPSGYIYVAAASRCERSQSFRMRAIETGISSQQSYSFTLRSSSSVTVSLTGLTRDFDCTVGNSNCTNNWGSADDSWSGTLGAGTHTVLVYPYGDGGPGDYTLTVAVNDVNLVSVASPLGSGPEEIVCKKDGVVIECPTPDETLDVVGEPEEPEGTTPPDTDPPPETPDPGDPPSDGPPTVPSLDADNNDIVDHWNVVVTEDECSLNFDLNDRLGTKYDGPNTVRRDHGGVDIQANLGDPVLAWRGGSVALVNNVRCGYGVDITHDNGWVTRYCHFRDPSTVSGTIRAGALVGLAGQTGRASGVHAHISVITGPESRVEYFDHVDAGGRPTDDQKNRDGC